MKLGRIIVLFLLFNSTVARADDIESIRNKILLRTNYLNVSNLGTSSGKSAIYAGIKLDYVYFVNPSFGIGIGAFMNPILSTNMVATYGVEFSGRFYFLGTGVPTLSSDTPTSAVGIERFNLYFAPIIRETTFYLGSNPLVQQSATTGSFFNFGGAAGLEVALGQKLQLNGEFIYDILTLSGSDDRVRLQSVGMWVGLGFLW